MWVSRGRFVYCVDLTINKTSRMRHSNITHKIHLFYSIPHLKIAWKPCIRIFNKSNSHGRNDGGSDGNDRARRLLSKKERLRNDSGQNDATKLKQHKFSTLSSILHCVDSEPIVWSLIHVNLFIYCFKHIVLQSQNWISTKLTWSNKHIQQGITRSSPS